MLKNEIYTGKMVQGKTKQSLYHGEKQIKTPRDEYVVVPNTHEAIISEEVFEKVIKQHLINAKKFGNLEKRPNTPVNLFKGIIFCGKCGSPLYTGSTSVTTSVQEHIYHFYYCRNKSSFVDKCNLKQINHDKILRLVFEIIDQYVQSIVSAKNKIIDESKKNNALATKNLIKSDIRKIEGNISNLNKYKKSLLESYLSKKIDETEYIKFMSSYDLDIQKQNQEINQLHKRLVEVETIHKAKWIDKFEMFSLDDNMTPELMKSLISRIVAYDNEKIEIEFKFSDEFQDLLKISEEVNVYEQV